MLNGLVISVDGNSIATNLTADDRLRSSMKLVVYRDKEIANPDTGEVLALGMDTLGEAITTKVGSKHSAARLLTAIDRSSPNVPKVGDRVATK